MKNKSLPLCLAIPFVGILMTSTSVAGSASELPSGLPVTDDLSVFLDTEAVELDGDRIIRVIDRSGRGNDALEVFEDPGEPGEPVLISEATPSGMSAVRFDGIGGYLEVAANPDDFDGAGKTTYVVFRPNSFPLGAPERMMLVSSLYSSPGDNPSHNLHTFATNRDDGSIAWRTGGLAIENPDADGNPLLLDHPNRSFESLPDSGLSGVGGEFHIGVNKWGSSRHEFNLLNADGDFIWDDGFGATGDVSGHLRTTIGANTADDLGDMFHGDIAAVLIYDRELTGSENSQVQAYLLDVYLDEEGGPEAADLPVTDGLIAHFTANEVITEGDNVTQMIDLSGRNNHANSVVGETPLLRPAPTFVEDATSTGLGAMRFDGWRQELEIASNPEDFDELGKTTFVVFRAQRFGLDSIISSSYGSLGPDIAGRPDGIHELQVRSGNELAARQRNAGRGLVTVTVGGVRDEEFNIGVNHQRENGDFSVILRNSQGARIIGTTSTDGIPTEHERTVIGSPGRGWSFFDGDIAAVVIYDRELSDSELVEVEEYLAERYGVESEIEHPSRVGNYQALVRQRGNLVHHYTFDGDPFEDKWGDAHLEEVSYGNDLGVDLVEGLDSSSMAIHTKHLDDDGSDRGSGNYYRTIDDITLGETVTFEAIFRPLGLVSTGYIQALSGRGYFLVQRGDNFAHRIGDQSFTNYLKDGSPYTMDIGAWYYFAGTFEVDAENNITITPYIANLTEGETILTPLDTVSFEDESSWVGTSPLGVGGLQSRTFPTGVGAAQAFPGLIDEMALHEAALTEQQLQEHLDAIWDTEIPGVGFAEWIADFDLPEGQDGPEANPSGDGAPNALKYALGLDPKVSSVDQMPKPGFIEVEGVEYLVLEVSRNPNAVESAFNVVVSDDLVVWESGEEHVTVIEETDTILRVRDNTPLTEVEKRFIRLEVVLEN